MLLTQKTTTKTKFKGQTMLRWTLWLALTAMVSLVFSGCTAGQSDTNSQTGMTGQTTRNEQSTADPTSQSDASGQATQHEDPKTDMSENTTDQSISESEQKGPYIKISPEDAKAWLEADDAPPLLDVRTPEEFAAGHIADALLFPVGDLQQLLGDIPAEKDEPLIIYCRSGNRTLVAADILIAAGFTQVYDLGGIIDWPYETVTD